ncbi:MAG: NINE protein [Candidatus Spyradosoma sp.]
MGDGMSVKRKERFVFIFLGLFFGAFGVHNFYAGYIRRGLIQLGATLLCGLLDIVSLVGMAVSVAGARNGESVPAFFIVGGVFLGLSGIVVGGLWIWAFVELFVVKTDARGVEFKPLD